MKVSKQSVKASSRLVRYEQVISVLIKYGFEDLLSHPPLNKFVPQQTFLVPNRNGRKVSQYSRYERLRLACEELGTSFIKFAQIASNRPDLIPDGLIQEFSKLQDQVKPVPLVQINEILDNELIRPLNDFVEYFDKKPLAAASMAQVHRAKLKGGQDIVLKIQRPGIIDSIYNDIAILKNIISVINNFFPQYKDYHLEEIVKMFEESIMEELNFRLEATNLKHFKKMFKGNEDVYIPDIYEELCTEKIICLEYIDGIKITNLEALQKLGIIGKEVAKKGIDLYFEQVFVHGFFHADPHPGNIFILKNGKIAFIDYGMMGSVTETDKIQFARLLLSVYERDVKSMKKAILKFSSGLSKEKQIELEYDIIYFLRNYSNVRLENIDSNEVMKGLNALFYLYKIKIPSKLLLLLKALVIIEGVGLMIDPEYDMISNIGPYAKRLLLKKYNPNQFQEEVLQTIEGGTLLLKDLPDDLRSIIRKIKEGKIHIEIEHKGLDPLLQTTEIVVNRISFTLITVAIILGSFLCISAELPPKILDVSAIGFVGLVISFLLALRILYSISRHGKF